MAIRMPADESSDSGSASEGGSSGFVSSEVGSGLVSEVGSGSVSEGGSGSGSGFGAGSFTSTLGNASA